MDKYKFSLEELSSKENVNKIKNDLHLGMESFDNITDGFHSFEELYYHRMILFSQLCKCYKDIAWKSKLHADGTMYKGMFVVGIKTPTGQATYHYELQFWSLFHVKTLEHAPVWDGHTPSQTIERIAAL